MKPISQIVLPCPLARRVVAGLMVAMWYMFLHQVIAVLEIDAQTTSSVRVAEGKYAVLTENGIGPFEPAVYGFSEEWTLWRMADGSFQVTGTRSYRSPSYESHVSRFLVRLTADLNVLELKEFRKLRFQRDSGPLTCDFLADRMSCSSHAKDATHNLSLDLPMHAPFGVIWPLSAFSLGSITHSATRDPKKVTPVELVRFDESSRTNSMRAMIFSGQLKYLGKEDVPLSDRNWLADKFQLRIPLHAPFLLWVSPRGLLLAFAPETADKSLANGMVLTHYENLEDF